MSDPVTQTPPPAPSPLPAATARRRRRRWPKVLVALVVLLVFGIAAAPTIVARTGLLNRIARQAATGLNGTLEVGGASLGWFSTVELRDVTITDARGRVVVRAPKVVSSRTLIGLLRDRANVGEFTFENPMFEITCENRTTNLEDVLRKYLEGGPAGGQTRPEVTVRVRGGVITLRGAEDTTGEVRDLDATVFVPAARSEPIAVKLSGSAPGRVEADVLAGDSGRVKLVSDGFALETLSPLLPRLAPDLTLGGSLTADLTVAWGKDGLTLDGTLGGKNLAVSGTWLKGDTLRLASAELPIRAAVSGGVVRVDRARLACDVGTIAAAGVFDPGDPVEKLLERPGSNLDADIDLARLAATLPKLLRVRGGTELREGKLAVRLESRDTPEGTAWTGSVNTTALRAVRDGREVRWDEPFQLEFAGRYKAGRLPTFDKLVCRSDFAAVQAEVTPDSVRAAANVYLDRLASRLGDFVDLGGAALDGRGTATLVARRAADNTFKAEASLELTQFAFDTWKEPQLSVRVSGAGAAPQGGPVSVSAATASVTAGADELRLALVEPIADAERLSSGKLDARLTGDLGRWWARVGTLVRLPKHYRLGGTATARGTVRFGPDVVAVDRLSLGLVNARFRGAGLDLEEDQMDAVADLTVDRRAGTATLAKFTINSVPLSISEGRLVIQVPDRGDVVVEGGGPAVVGLGRLGKTLKLHADPRGPSSFHGRGTGPIRFRHSGDVTTFGGTLDVVSFSVGLPSAPDWTEPKLRLETEGSYTESTDTVALTLAKIERPGLALDAKGSLARVSTTVDLGLNGTLAYDLAALTPKLREELGGGFSGRGRGTTPVSLSGSLAPAAKPGAPPPGPFAATAGELRIGWESLHAYGFDVGRGELHAKLSGGICRVEPVAATFGGGKVNAHPTLRLDPAPAEVSLAKGTIVDRAKLTPAVCADALGYALPAIFKSGQASGEISVVLGENHVPLADAGRASVRGRLVIHQATVAPGPVVAEIARLLGAGNVAMTVPAETVVPVRVEKGAVHHQNFVVQIGGHTVVTSGSVGLDGKLDLIADVPVPAGLLRGSPAAAKALAGKRIKVPIAGTLSRPALDPRQFQAAVAKLASEAAVDLGKEFFNKELERLLPGMPGPKK